MSPLLRWRRRSGPLSCRKVGQVLQAYLDNELDDEELAARVSEHLEACDRCGLDAGAFREIKAALGRPRTALDDITVHRLRDFGRTLMAGEG